MPSESPLNDRRAKLKTKTELVTVKKCKVRQRPRALSIQYPLSTIQCPVSPDWIWGVFLGGFGPNAYGPFYAANAPSSNRHKNRNAAVKGSSTHKTRCVTNKNQNKSWY